MRPLILTAILWIPALAWAQNDAQIAETDEVVPVTEDKDSVRRYYIKQFPEHFFVYPVLKQRSLHFELAKRDRSASLTYKPNSTYNLGLGVYLFELGLEFSYAIPLKEKSLERFGESKARDVQLHVLSKRWGADIFYQRYKGFYIVDKENEPLAAEPFPQRPDINTKSFGITTHYVFNNQKFSFRSAYNFAERQLYSKGSLLLFGALNTFRVRADSSVVNDNRQSDFGDHVAFTRLRYTSFAIAPGYTFSITYNNFFLNTTLAVGPAHHWINYDLEDSPATHYDTDINAFVGARVAIGYNGYRIFGGISFISQGSTIKFDSVNFSNNNSVFKILVGYRFREFGILKKRVRDMIPFEI